MRWMMMMAVLGAVVMATLFMAGGSGVAQAPNSKGARIPLSVEDEIRLLRLRVEALEGQTKASAARDEQIEGDQKSDRTQAGKLEGRIAILEKENQGLRAWKDDAEKLLPPRGAILPYFGDQLPGPNYVWADGTTPWPSDPWVPEPLRGVPVPDMSGYFLGGTSNLALVGRPWNEGRLTVPEITIRAESFNLPQPKEQLGEPFAQNDLFVLRWWAGGVPPLGIGAFGNPEASPVPGSQNPADLLYPVRMTRSDRGGTNPGCSYDPVRLYGAVPKSVGLSGSQTVAAVRLMLDGPESNPRHVMCRWIIRVK
jgi:hypothetical protein